MSISSSDREHPGLNNGENNDESVETQTQERRLTQVESSEDIVAEGENQVEPGVDGDVE